jgi:hypothetical protein
MSVLSLVFVGWIALNALIFISLMFRRHRPAARLRLFRWILYTNSGSRARDQHSHVPT